MLFPSTLIYSSVTYSSIRSSCDKMSIKISQIFTKFSKFFRKSPLHMVTECLGDDPHQSGNGKSSLNRLEECVKFLKQISLRKDLMSGI